MGESYSFEVVERAEQLYCVEGHTFEQVATLTGVAPSTLKRWAADYGWQEAKERIRKALASIRTNTIMLRARLIENCMETLSAKDAFAVASLEKAALQASELALKRQASGAVAGDEGLQRREIKTEADAVAALEEAVQIKLNAMLADPSRVNLAAVKDVKQVLDLLKKLKAESGDGADKPKAVDARTLQDLRKQLGL